MPTAISVVWSNDNLYDNLNHGTSMKKIIIVIVAALLASEIVQAQGTIYLSNLGQPSTGTLAVGSDSWLAGVFKTGDNVAGYILNSIQLEMTDASGNPSGFTVMVYANSNPATISPGSNIGTINGSLTPATGGIYTYTPAANLTLSAFSSYFIVLTAGTTIANGAYDWSLAGANSYNPNGHWGGITGVWNSSNGSSWNLPTPTAVFPQYAITATAIPEPPSAFLLLLGSGVLLYVRRIFHR
jgi:hypothetical protein